MVMICKERRRISRDRQGSIYQEVKGKMKRELEYAGSVATAFPFSIRQYYIC